MSSRQLVRVRDVMNPEYDMVDRMATLQEALDSMRHPKNRCMVVRKRHKDDEFGLLLISDVARKVLATDRPLQRVNVYEVMQKPVITVDSAMDIRYCARLLDRFHLSRVPVVEDGEVVGIASFSNLVLRGMEINRE